MRRSTLITILPALAAASGLFFFASSVAAAGICPTSGQGGAVQCSNGATYCGGSCVASEPTCPNSGVAGDPRTLSCGSCTCACASGSYCSTPSTANYNKCVASQSCPAGQTFDICSGTCKGDVAALIHDYSTVTANFPQGAATQDLRIVGKMQAGDFCIAGGGSCLSTNTGVWNKFGGTGPDITFNAGNVGIGTGATAPAALLQVVAASTVGDQ